MGESPGADWIRTGLPDPSSWSRVPRSIAARCARVVCVALTSNLLWAAAPGNVLLPARATRLGRDSVANVSQIVTLDRAVLTERVARLPRATLELVLAGIDIVLGRT